jgi:predicted deacylase
MAMSPSYFSADYFSARDRFRGAAVKAGGRLSALMLAAKGPRGEELTIDIAWFGTESPDRVLLHSSGIHGVEGFAGSAIQLQVLDKLPPLVSGTALVMVHVLNPYGMAWIRRVNENNVDLNRNFCSPGRHAGSPPMYPALDPFLNPASPPGFDFYSVKAARMILRHGMTALKQSVAGGQYDFPRGLFFGGRQMEDGPRQYEQFLQQRLATVENVIVIDVHTGLGKFAEDSLLVEPVDAESLRAAFGERITPLQPDQGAAYRIQGGLESMIFRVFTRRRPVFIGQEIGTYLPAKVLYALREENRWHHYGEGTLDHPAKRRLMETFCPADESWRRAVLKRGQEVIMQALGNLKPAI